MVNTNELSTENPQDTGIVSQGPASFSHIVVSVQSGDNSSLSDVAFSKTIENTGTNTNHVEGCLNDCTAPYLAANDL